MVVKCPSCNSNMALKQSKYGVYWECECKTKLNLNIDLLPNKEDIEVFKQSKIDTEIGMFRGQCLNIAGNVVSAMPRHIISDPDKRRETIAEEIWQQTIVLFKKLKEKKFLELR